MSNNKNKDNDEKEMSFFEHLDEFRSHLIRSAWVILIASVFVFFASDIVFGVILFGPLRDDFPTYQFVCWISDVLGMGTDLCFKPVRVDLETFELGEAFMMHLKVSFFGGLALAIPFVLWEIWKFVRPALYANERAGLKGLVGWGTFLFLLGMSFGYFILAPFAVNFFAGYELPMINQDSGAWEAMKYCASCCGGAIPEKAAGGGILKASSYLNYMLMFTFPVGLVFELPVIIYYLARVGMVTPTAMRKYRRHAIIIILIVAAIVTPPDVVTQIIVAIPMYILYELSIGIAAKQAKKYEESQKENS